MNDYQSEAVNQTRKLMAERAANAARSIKDANEKPKRVKKTPKLRNKKVERHGIMFDSTKEANRYDTLKSMEERGEITDLQFQVKFELLPNVYETIPQYGKRGQRIKDKRKLVDRGVSYIADFVYFTSDGEKVVEDVKGYRDPASATYAKFVLKRKMMLYFHQIRIKEV